MLLLDFLTDINNSLSQFIWFQGLKFLLGLFSIILLLNIILILYDLLVRYNYWTEFLYGRSIPKLRGIMNKRWKQVLELLESREPGDRKAAIVKAGEIAFEVFQRIGYPGEDLTEQLENMIGYQISNLEEVKEADRTRRRIIEDFNYQPTAEETYQAVKAFGEAVWEMEAIDKLGLKPKNIFLEEQFNPEPIS